MRLRPTAQITIGLVVLTSAVLLIIDMLFGVFAAPDDEMMRLRKGAAETMAIEVAVLLEEGDRRALVRTLDRVRQSDPTIRSLAVRRSDGSLVASSGDHAAAWRRTSGEESTPVQLFVPLSSDSGRWGSFELTYLPDGRGVVERALGQPRWVALLAAAVLGAVVYFQYMRRALVHLDPKAVIPERVKLAFDIMTEGVVVLDRRGRVLLANHAFCALSPDGGADIVGRPLSGVAWLTAGLPGERAMHPWEQAMQAGSPEMGCTLEVAGAANGNAKLVVNCAPIADPRGAVRGCVVTIADLTALHLANERLSSALAELGRSRDEIARKNVELEHLATHDVLTGCLTRGAFLVRMAQQRLAAQHRRRPMVCLALDIDRFKIVNDNFGHTIGDRVIEVVGNALITSLRPADIAGRYGGDEFFIGMPDCNLDEGLAAAEQIRRTVEDRCRTALAHVEGLAITVSVGVAALRDGDEDLGDLIDRADAALYRAKADGRNRVAAESAPAVRV